MGVSNYLNSTYSSLPSLKLDGCLAVYISRSVLYQLSAIASINASLPSESVNPCQGAYSKLTEQALT